MNDQPFYHDLSILFTATRPIAQQELDKLLKEIHKLGAVVDGSAEIQYLENEAGDPADLA